jgi:hemolysin III
MQSLGASPPWYEELANSLSHGIGFVAALVLMPMLLLETPHRAPNGIIGTAIFSATMALLYLASTLYHAVPQGRLKQFFLQFDYAAIFLFIAGSYTAFACGAVTSIGAWILFSLVWGTAIVGLLLKLCGGLTHPLHSAGYFLALGWLALIAAIVVLAQLPKPCLFWLCGGGIIYSAGVVFYLLGTRLRFSHLGWHVCVMLGNACHCVALMHY